MAITRQQLKLVSRITMWQKLRHPIGWLRVRRGMNELMDEFNGEKK